MTYHIFNRSNGRVPVFIEPEDFEYFKAVLIRYKKRFDFKIYHWVIMTNHYHFLLECDEPEMISKIMAGVNKSYTFYYHRDRGTSGFLWQGRFKMQAVQNNYYFIACGRYIEQNPVKAGIVQRAEGYLYSSARRYCYECDDGLTDTSPFYSEMGADEEKRKLSYQDFLKSYDREHDQCFEQAERPMGYEAFLNRLVKEKGRDIPRRRGRSRIGI